MGFDYRPLDALIAANVSVEHIMLVPASYNSAMEGYRVINKSSGIEEITKGIARALENTR